MRVTRAVASVSPASLGKAVERVMDIESAPGRGLAAQACQRIDPVEHGVAGPADRWRSGHSSRPSAAAPLTCGAAIEVPLMEA